MVLTLLTFSLPVRIMQQQPPASALQQYRQLLSDCQSLQVKISELEMDKTEHLLVEETLKPLDPSRRAYRLVGECLVERTVQEVLPSVTANRENVRSLRES
jgi:prefoldin subunit 2